MTQYIAIRRVISDYKQEEIKTKQALNAMKLPAIADKFMHVIEHKQKIQPVFTHCTHQST